MIAEGFVNITFIILSIRDIIEGAFGNIML